MESKNQHEKSHGEKFVNDDKRASRKIIPGIDTAAPERTERSRGNPPAALIPLLLVSLTASLTPTLEVSEQIGNVRPVSFSSTCTP